MAYSCYKTKYVTSQGETWDEISELFYGSPYYMAELIAANAEYSDVLVFDAGAALRIPILDQAKRETLPPWKRGAK